MNEQQKTFNLIKELTGQSNILSIPRIFIEYTGTWETAVLLSQLLYWTGKQEDKNGWIYKTYKEWESEKAIKENVLRKAAKKLIVMNILETKVKKANGNPTVHYKIKKDSFLFSITAFIEERSFQNEGNETSKMKGTINTEITTEITTENINVNKKHSHPVNYFSSNNINSSNSISTVKLLKELVQAAAEKNGEEVYYHDAKQAKCLQTLIKRYGDDISVYSSKIEALVDKIKKGGEFWREQEISPSTLLCFWGKLKINKGNESVVEEVYPQMQKIK